MSCLLKQCYKEGILCLVFLKAVLQRGHILSRLSIFCHQPVSTGKSPESTVDHLYFLLVNDEGLLFEYSKSKTYRISI